VNSGPTPLQLDDDEWRRLAGIVGLRDEARALVENILGQAKFIAELDKTATPPRATRKRLLALRRKAEKLFDEFGNLEPNVFMALMCADAKDRFKDEAVGPWAPPLLTRLQMFNDGLGKCRSLILGTLDDAIVPSEPSGNKTAAGDWLTGEIARLLERETPHRLTTTERPHDPAKEFLAECRRLAGVEVTAESMARRLRRKVPVRKSTASLR